MQSRRIAPPLDLRAEIESDDLSDMAKPAQTQSLTLRPAPKAQAPKLLDKKLVLKRIYRQFPKLKLNQLVAKAIIEQPKLTLREAEQYFKLRREQDRLAKEKDPKKRKVRKDKESVSTRIGGLSEEQQKLLEDVFYRQYKGSLGARGLWEILKQHPKQQAALNDGKKRPEAFITWRDMRAWHGAQEVVQKHARANKASRTLVKLPTVESLKPFLRMQIDTIELAQGSSKKDDDGAWKPGQSLSEDLDKRGLPDQGQRKVYHMVDLATNYSFLAAAPKVDQDSAIRAVTEFIENIRDQFGDGSWPHDEPFVLISDSGKEYGRRFQEEVRTFEPKARFVRNPPGVPNADAYVEGANAIFRRIAKKRAEVTKEKHKGSSKSYLSRWFGGPKGEILQEIASLMNTRPVSSLGYQTPADVLAAMMAKQPDEEDKEIVAKAVASKTGTARKRRAASIVTAYKRGSSVRRISDKYLKASTRGNVMKQQPQWGPVQTITKVQARVGVMPRYQLDNVDEWVPHDRLNPVRDGIVLRPPPSVNEDPDYLLTKKLPDRVFYRGFPLAEKRDALIDEGPSAMDRAAASLGALLY
eukprot:COSAG02_NODE_2266_length_9286_cov_2.788723_3_plen_582_part_00